MPFDGRFLAGETAGLQMVGQIVDAVRDWDRQDRTALLRRLAALPGVYVPAFFTPRYADDGTLLEMMPLDPERPVVAKRVLTDLDAFPPPTDPIVPNLGVVHDRASVDQQFRARRAGEPPFSLGIACVAIGARGESQKTAAMVVA